MTPEEAKALLNAHHQAKDPTVRWEWSPSYLEDFAKRAQMAIDSKKKVAPKPLAGCGPYLMTYDNMNLEKETKMSEQEASDAVVEGLRDNKASRSTWHRLVAQGLKTSFALTPGVTPDLYEQKMTASKDASQKAMAELTTQSMQVKCYERQMSRGTYLGAIYGSPPDPEMQKKAEALIRLAFDAKHFANGPYRGIGDNQAPQVASESERIAVNRVYNAEGRVKELEERLAMLCVLNTQLHDALKIRTDERDALKQKTSAAEEEPGSHPYHGPAAPDASGRNVSIPDEVHERFHKAIGDIHAGKVIPAARKQMEDALRQTPKDAPTTASTSRPMPGNATRFAVLEKGIRL